MYNICITIFLAWIISRIFVVHEQPLKSYKKHHTLICHHAFKPLTSQPHIEDSPNHSWIFRSSIFCSRPSRLPPIVWSFSWPRWLPTSTCRVSASWRCDLRVSTGWSPESLHTSIPGQQGNKAKGQETDKVKGQGTDKVKGQKTDKVKAWSSEVKGGGTSNVKGKGTKNVKEKKNFF